jgi:hypothetical protein
MSGDMGCPQVRIMELEDALQSIVDYHAVVSRADDLARVSANIARIALSKKSPRTEASDLNERNRNRDATNYVT